MATAPNPFSTWLTDAQLCADHLTTEQHALLQAAFRFRQRSGDDYYSTRLLSHFLLHCDSGLKVATIARLLGLSRPTASRQQGLSAKQAIQQAHHRLDGRPYGKLLPRYAGPIAEFLLTHPDASRADVLDFIEQAFAVRVSRVALARFLKKFGLDAASRRTATTTAAAAVERTAPAATLEAAAPSATVPAVPEMPPPQPVPTPAPPFSSHAPSTPAPS
jgi:hypothetical protein